MASAEITFDDTANWQAASAAATTARGYTVGNPNAGDFVYAFAAAAQPAATVRGVPVKPNGAIVLWCESGDKVWLRTSAKSQLQANAT